MPGEPGGGGAVGSNTAGMSDQEAAMVKAVGLMLGFSRGFQVLTMSVRQMQGAMESCPFKTVLSGGMGFALGGAFGLFMSSVSLKQNFA